MPERCCAPLSNNKRCPNNIREDSSIHCEDHYPRGIRLYKAYKKLCDMAEAFNLSKVDTFPFTLDKIKYLNQAYYIHKRAYEGRMEHRIYGLVPECYDYGHDAQFDIIYKNISQCETELRSLYDQYFKEKEVFELAKDIEASEGKVDVDEEVKQSENDLQVQEVINTVSDFRTRRSNDEREERIAIEKYIEENKHIIHKKSVIVDKLLLKFKSLMTINPKYEYYQIVSIYIMIRMIDTVLESFEQDKRNVNRLRFLRLSDAYIKKYSNITEYFNDQDESDLVITLENLDINGLKALKSFFTAADIFFANNNVNINKTITVLAWNPYHKDFFIAYTSTTKLSDLEGIKSFSRLKQVLRS